MKRCRRGKWRRHNPPPAISMPNEIIPVEEFTRRIWEDAKKACGGDEDRALELVQEFGAAMNSWPVADKDKKKDEGEGEDDQC